MQASCGGGEDPDSQSDSMVAEKPAIAIPDPVGDSASNIDFPTVDSGEGFLVVGDQTYAFRVMNCKVKPDGAFDAAGNDSDSKFKMIQFYLDGKWFQTTVSIDMPGPKEIIARQSPSMKGAMPATVELPNITWAATFEELDTEADSLRRLDEGHITVACP